MLNLPTMSKTCLGLTFIIVAILGGGCSDQVGQEQLDFMEQKVGAGLSCWQAGKKPATLNTGDAPFEFYDEDWKRGVKLLSFEIRKTYFSSSQQPRCFVELELKRGNKPATKILCNFSIVTEPTVIVERDPMG